MLVSFLSRLWGLEESHIQSFKLLLYSRPQIEGPLLQGHPQKGPRPSPVYVNRKNEPERETDGASGASELSAPAGTWTPLRLFSGKFVV